MNILALFFIFILGVIVGSFLNVVALRYNTGLSVSKGRSVCFYCNQKIRWYDLVPILSFFFLGGKCRVCKMPISWQYPMVEFLTGIVFVLTAIRQYYSWEVFSLYQNGLIYSVLFFIYYCVIFSILIVISIYDINHKIIPNKLVYLFIILSIAKLLLFFCCFGFTYDLKNILNLLSPIILFIPFAFLWLVSSGRWIGFGDAKLAIGIGALLGFVSGVSAIILAFWIGAVWGILLIIISKIYKKSYVNFKSEVPFAPFMIIATFIVFLTRIDVLGLRDLISYFQ